MKLLDYVVIAAVAATFIGGVVSLAHSTQQAGRARQTQSYDVVCVSGGIPVMRFTASSAYLQNGGWHFTADGVEYRTNLECIARPSP